MFLADIPLRVVGCIQTPVSDSTYILLFATEDDFQFLPVWSEAPYDRAGRPSDVDTLTTMLHCFDRSRWTAEISTMSRGQFTATLRNESYSVDARPWLVYELWSRNMLSEIYLKETLAGALVDCPPNWMESFRISLAPSLVELDRPSPTTDVQGIGSVLIPVKSWSWNPQDWEIDGFSPLLSANDLDDEEFDDEMRKLLGE